MCVGSCQGQDGDGGIGRVARGPRTNQVNKIRVLILRKHHPTYSQPISDKAKTKKKPT